ncbi:hypothetical protein CgunFtcFv8_005039 [Champsocephalus gunnari]|uniref:Uncharacterized protein n=1 Tax=Champsocephalus gunnari TaxID=52237 RepID=A0AAN8HD23_CHAGU|nr:hypothetical protein CgunFtcFv8_005039 [Champsocephalus gunnari]
MSKGVHSPLGRVYIINAWLWIHPVCVSVTTVSANQHQAWPERRRDQHRSDVRGSTSQSAEQLFINCRRVEVFTAAHVSATHNFGAPPPVLPLAGPPDPMRDFHEVKLTCGVLQMSGEPPSHVPMMKQMDRVSQVSSLPQIH